VEYKVILFYYAFDMDQAKNIVIGGYTSDPGVANLQSQADPIASDDGNWRES
jgi:hypothetical protein